MCRSALTNDYPVKANVDQIFKEAKDSGISDEQLIDSIEILENRGYCSVTRVLSGKISSIHVSTYALDIYCNQCVKEYPSFELTVISTIANNNKFNSKEISEFTKIPVSYVAHILNSLSSQRKIKTTVLLSGVIQILPTNFAELKRLLK